MFCYYIAEILQTSWIPFSAFDEEEIHRVINEELGATSMIPLKKGAKKGKYQLAMQSLFSKPKYHLRSLVETVISVRKRIFGDSNTSQSDRLRNKETKLKNRCYNIYCYVKRLSLQTKDDFYIT